MLLFVGVVMAVGSWEWYAQQSVFPGCAEDLVFNSSSITCETCVDDSEVNAQGGDCWCKQGTIGVPGECAACPANTVPDSKRLTCIPCSASTTRGIASNECQCSGANDVLVDYLEGTRLEEKACLDCSLYLLTANTTTQQCVPSGPCPTAFTLYQSTCVPTTELEQVLATYTASDSYLSRNAVISAAFCLAGVTGATGCRHLGNLCTLQTISEIDSATDACQLYTYVGTQNASRAPPLFYESASMLDTIQQDFVRNVDFDEDMSISVTAYTVNGTFRGVQPLSNQVFMCEVVEPVAAHGLSFGNNIITKCAVNDVWLSESAGEPLLFQLFIKNEAGAEVPVPVRIGNDGDSTEYFYGTQRDVVQTQMLRRFALYDNLLSTRTVWYADELTIVVATRDTNYGAVYTPLVTVHYTRLDRKTLPPPPIVPRTVFDDGVGSTSSIFYVSDINHSALIALIITSCCVSFATSLVKAWAWQRRLVSPYLDPFSGLIRWMVYYASHLAFYFFVVTSGATMYYFLWFKGQSRPSVLLPPPSSITSYFTALLWTAFACRCIDVGYRVFEQCYMWVFFLDWEQPRGRLMAENKEVPVSMWRMVFAANQFNVLQSQLSFKIYTTLFMVLVLLEAFQLQGLTTAQPNGNNLSQQGSFSHPLLRIALTVILWYGVTFVLWLWEALVYHRFLAADPVREFNDLLSLANVSMFCLLERRNGFYIHGKSVHQFADASVREFQAMLKREEEGGIPMRGLAGQSEHQTFEILVDDNLSKFLYETQMVLNRERMPQLQGQGARPRRCYELLLGRRSRNILTQDALMQLQELNRVLQAIVTRIVEDVQAKTAVHKSLGVIPFVFPGMPTRFFLDSDTAWARCILLYLEPAISNCALLLYLSLDFHFQNAFVSASIAFLFILFVQAVRNVLGVTNLGQKTMIDDRFFL
eukprot:TRINITY_DN30706_c0_g1_i1.p1 TRINITY_DN30706_c0_g1~~TRINITY_DN30706_c0_g1_i1.p1  ORF type:complete len:927 (+),score=160.67 TRINITY_DN30706_c0_g1_i1:55-2835(+)